MRMQDTQFCFFFFYPNCLIDEYGSFTSEGYNIHLPALWVCVGACVKFRLIAEHVSFFNDYRKISLQHYISLFLDCPWFRWP